MPADPLRTSPSSPSAPAAPARERPTGGLALVLELADPSRFPDLKRTIERAQPRIDEALESLHHVHFARFLPLPKDRPTHLIVVTEYEGSDDAYILDFAAVLGDVFTAILGFVKEPPPLPVSRHPYAFLNFVRKHDVPVRPWSAYGDRTVVELLQGHRQRPAPPAADAEASVIDMNDVQGNLLRGYPARRARHYALRVTRPAAAGEFLAGIAGGDESAYPQVTTAADLARESQPERFLNVGVTFAGLRTLGVPARTLDLFPQAFREGPAHPGRAAGNGDTGASDPRYWILGGPGAPVDLLVSLYTKADDDEPFGTETARLEKLFEKHGLRVVPPCHDARALPGHALHFGFRDGIGQPRIAGAEASGGHHARGMQPRAAAGDFLLGRDYRNHLGGNWIGAVPYQLPAALCDNATYAAVRVAKQDVVAFERMLATESARHGLDPELLAAKLMGRWRNGEPLALSPEQPRGTMRAEQLDEFDYTPSQARPGIHDDRDGLRCPVGSHVRRMNPRGALVAGKPHSRRVIRRGMPYGPPYEGKGADAADDGVERGVFGLFLCADLQTQYEFILRAWANGDRAAAGLRGTRDPIIGSREEHGTFRLPTAESPEGLEIRVPPLVVTRGALYLLVPGVGGLQHLAQLARAASAAGARRGAPRRKFHPEAFDPADAAFRADPYPTYARFREHAPVAWIPRYKAWWVFSHALVKEVCEHPQRFPKRLPPREPESLFFMDPPRHTEVRELLDRLFHDAIEGLPKEASERAGRLLSTLPPAFDLVSAYAKPLPRDTLMTLLGIAGADRPGYEARIDVAFDSNDLLASDSDRRAADAARAFLAERFGSVMADGCPAGRRDGGLLCAMARHAADLREPLSAAERVRTAISFALAGYLSSEFLLGTGVYHLLRDRDPWERLKSGEVDADQAVREMLRYEAPFQLADRYAAEETPLGGVTIPARAKVTVVYASANRDEAVFGDGADTFDIGRRPPPGTEWGALALSPGIHRCIGEPLIRHTLPIAIEALVRRRPGLVLDGEPAWQGDPYFRSIRRLPVRG